MIEQPLTYSNDRDIYNVDCWTSGNPGIGGWKVLKNGEPVDSKDYVTPHSNNYYELCAILSAASLASLEPQQAIIYSDSLIAIGWISKRPKKCLEPESIEKFRKEINRLLGDHKNVEVRFWNTRIWGENPADYGRKSKKRIISLSETPDLIRA